MTHFTESHPVARKPHRCGTCGRTIRPGETYRRGAGMDGSHAWTWKECAHCEALIRYLTTFSGESEYDAEELVSDWDVYTIPHARIRAQYRARWTRRDGALYPIPHLIEQAHERYHYPQVADIAPGVAQ